NTGPAAANGPDLFGTFITIGNCIVGTGLGNGYTITTDLGGNQLGVNPLLSPLLQNNGGPVPTLSLLPGSPALNARTNAFATRPPFSTPATDARGAGFNRIILGTVDVGAYEVQPPGTVTTLIASAPTIAQGQAVTFTATVQGAAQGGSPGIGTVLFLVDGFF